MGGATCTHKNNQFGRCEMGGACQCAADVDIIIQKVVHKHRNVLDALAAYDRGECVCEMLGEDTFLCPQHGEGAAHE